MDRYTMSKGMKMVIASDIYDAVCEKKVAFIIGSRSKIYRVLPVEDDTIDIWSYGIDEVPSRLVEGAGIDNIFAAVDVASIERFFAVTISDVLELTPEEAIAGTALDEWITASKLVGELNSVVDNITAQNIKLKEEYDELKEEKDELFDANAALTNSMQNIQNIMEDELQSISSKLESALEDIDCEVNECSDYL